MRQGHTLGIASLAFFLVSCCASPFPLPFPYLATYGARSALLELPGPNATTSRHSLPFMSHTLDRLQFEYAVGDRTPVYMQTALSPGLAASILPLADLRSVVQRAENEGRYSLAEGPTKTAKNGDKVKLTRGPAFAGDPAARRAVGKGKNKGGPTAPAHNLIRALASGSSAVLHSAHNLHSGIAALTESWSAAFTGNSEANVYITPPTAEVAALALHHDTHGVLAVQLHGRKTWRLFPPLHPLPTVDQTLDGLLQGGASGGPTAPEIRELVAGAERMGGVGLLSRRPGGVTNASLHALPLLVTLHPGDMLYLPHGVLHEAVPAHPRMPGGVAPHTNEAFEHELEGLAGPLVDHFVAETGTSIHVTMSVINMHRYMAEVVHEGIAAGAAAGIMSGQAEGLAHRLLEDVKYRTPRDIAAAFPPAAPTASRSVKGRVLPGKPPAASLRHWRDLDPVGMYLGAADRQRVSSLVQSLFEKATSWDQLHTAAGGADLLHAVGAPTDSMLDAQYPLDAGSLLLRSVMPWRVLAPRGVAPAFWPCVAHHDTRAAGVSSRGTPSLPAALRCSLLHFGSPGAAELHDQPSRAQAHGTGDGSGAVDVTALQYAEDTAHAASRRAVHMLVHGVLVAAAEMRERGGGAVAAGRLASAFGLEHVWAWHLHNVYIPGGEVGGAQAGDPGVPSAADVEDGAQWSVDALLWGEECDVEVVGSVPVMTPRRAALWCAQTLLGQVLPGQRIRASDALQRGISDITIANTLSDIAEVLPDEHISPLVAPQLFRQLPGGNVTLQRRGDVPAFLSFTSQPTGVMPGDTGVNLYYSRVTRPGPALATSPVRPRTFAAALGVQPNAWSTSTPQCSAEGVASQVSQVHGKVYEVEGWTKAARVWMRGSDPLQLASEWHEWVAQAMLSMPSGVSFTLMDACMEGAVLGRRWRGGVGGGDEVLQGVGEVLSSITPAVASDTAADDWAACRRKLPDAAAVAHILATADAIVLLPPTQHPIVPPAPSVPLPGFPPPESL